MRISWKNPVEKGLEPGLREIAPLLGLEIAAQGAPAVETIRGEGLSVESVPGGYRLTWGTKAEFFRALALLKRYEGESAVTVRERRCFERCGVMLDSSRNAVPTVDAVKEILRRMALMGLDWLMLYTEDTYEIDGLPYFGYLRGAYTQQELREMDDYADALGIEMIPCIQTLAHLERALHWPAMQRHRDTEAVLLLGEDETYALIERMLKAASAPFRSKRIHIGMDEAAKLGLGAYLGRHGYHTCAQLMKEHLARVHGILQKLGLQAMMWSDMHFTAASPTRGLYDPDCVLTDEILSGAPQDIDLVYWDYYHDTEKTYDRMFSEHGKFSARTVFAGGIWTWLGPATDYRKTKASALPALRQCREHGVKEVFATAWNDDGAEANILSILYGLQLYAEFNYTGGYDETELAARFRVCGGADAQAFLDMSRFNELPGMEIQPESTANPCKVLLFEDPLIPQFEADYHGLADPAYYAQLARRFTEHREKNPRLQTLMEFYVRLAQALEIKCIWRRDAARCVRAGDRDAALGLCDVARQAAGRLGALREAWRALWFSTNKPYGFEVIDLRMGGAEARFSSAQARMDDFARGRIQDIPELSCEKLPYLKDEQGRLCCINSWAAFASPNIVAQ